jgi:hypothetical protein
MFLLIMQIPQGKTTQGRKQWGRATRHRLVELCCIGAISQYLQFCVNITGEFLEHVTQRLNGQQEMV